MQTIPSEGESLRVSLSRPEIYFLVFSPFFLGIVAVILGQDINWDLRNYHFYNPYAFLKNRLDFDIVPSHTPNFYNPLLYIPFYFLVTSLKPIYVAFILGTIQGINIPLVYLISKRMLFENDRRVIIILSILISILGVLGGGNFGEIGTMFADNILSIPILISFYIIITSQDRYYLHGNSISAMLLIAGIFAGISAGFKLTNAFFCIGLLSSIFVTKQSGRPYDFSKNLFLAFFFGVGVTLGVIISGGYWFYLMWEKYQNPFFPYFNHIFKSPWGDIAHYRDIRFLPENILEWLFLPFIWAIDPLQVGEVYFRDLRLPIMYGLVLSMPLIVLIKKDKTRFTPTIGRELILLSSLLVFFVVSYLLWLKMFSIYRYLILFEFLSILVIYLIVKFICQRLEVSSKVTFTIFGIIVLVIIFTIKPANWGRSDWRDDYFGVVPPNIDDPKNTIILMTGHEPNAYIIPYFPEEIPFIRIQGFFTGPKENLNGFDMLIRKRIQEHWGDIYVIYFYLEEKLTLDSLKFHNLRLLEASCTKFKPEIDYYIYDIHGKSERHFKFCRVVKE